MKSIALRSKAYWNYDAAFMRRFEALLDLRAAEIARQYMYVVEKDGATLGFYRLRHLDGRPFLDDLWVDPPQIGTGLGRRLWLHALETARSLSWHCVFIESDPHAETFYLHMSAVRVGQQWSPTGRLLPLLRFELAPMSAAGTNVE